MMEAKDMKQAVRERYGRKAAEDEACCAPGCCGSEVDGADVISKAVGYDEQDMANVPEGANLGLGCGNPVAFAEMSQGETVLDLGSGAGFDCFLAAAQVGPSGRVIGVDMTPEMLEKARSNQKKGDYDHVEFRLGEIEALPVGDQVVDVIISNCVLCLSTDRPRVLAEALRVLKPGGRLMISDMVSDVAVPDFIAASKDAMVACMPVALEEYRADLAAAGFENIEVETLRPYPPEYLFSDPQVVTLLEQHPDRSDEVDLFVRSIYGGSIKAIKPQA